MLHNSTRRHSIPEFNVIGWLAFSCKQCLDLGFQIFQSAELIATLIDGDGPFGIGPHGQTGYSQIASLFLNPARIRNDQTGIEEEIHEPDIAYGIEQE